MTASTVPSSASNPAGLTTVTSVNTSVTSQIPGNEIVISIDTSVTSQTPGSMTDSSVSMTDSSVSSSTSTAAEGCFTRFSNLHVRGGILQSRIASEDACKSACLRYQSCVSVDWDKVYMGCYFATNATDPTRYNWTRITHWHLDRTCKSGNEIVISIDTSVTSQTPGSMTDSSVSMTDSSVSSSTSTAAGNEAVISVDTSVTSQTPGSMTDSSVSMTDSSVSSSTSTAAEGCFTRFSNLHVRGGILQSRIASEDACKSACLRYQSCVSVDWDNVDIRCYFATNATDPTRYNWTRITHWHLDRTCKSGNETVISVDTSVTSQTPGSMTESPVSMTDSSVSSSTSTAAEGCFTLYNNSHVRGGIVQWNIASEDACKSACLRNQSCVSVDWDNGAIQCYFATNATDPTRYNWTRITHWHLDRTCKSGSMTDSSVSSSTSTAAAGCFTRHNNTHRLGGYWQSTITSEDACKSACLRNQSCISVDWNNSNKACVFATNATDPTKYNMPHITHWDLNRTCNSGKKAVTLDNTLVTSQTPVVEVFCIGGFVISTIIISIIVVAVFVKRSSTRRSLHLASRSEPTEYYDLIRLEDDSEAGNSRRVNNIYTGLQPQSVDEKFPQCGH